MEKIISTYMIPILFSIFFCLFQNTYAFGQDILTTKYYKDINNDGRPELLVHDSIGGTGAYGMLTIYNNKGKVIFKENVQGDPYLENPKKHTLDLNPLFFKDINGDGIIEILVGQHKNINGISNYDSPWKYKVFKWNGKKYRPAKGKYILQTNIL